MLITEEIGDSYIMNYRYDLNGTLVAVSRSNLTDGSSSILFAQTNPRGDVVSLYNSSGVVKVNYVYDSWGKLLSATDGNGNALAENSVGALNAIRYRGYVYDSETGFYYLQSRYYDPETGRFINADDVNYLGMNGSVLSYNAFAYCENNAVNAADCLGALPYMVFKENESWKNISFGLMKNCSIVYVNNPMVINTAFISKYNVNKKKGIFKNYYTIATGNVFGQRSIEQYYFATYTEWCYYICVENKNLLKKHSINIQRRAAKVLMKYDNTLSYEDAMAQIKFYVDAIKDVVIKSIDDVYRLNIGYVVDIISIAYELIDVYYRKFSKEVKYIAQILDNIEFKYTKGYNIFIPYYVFYERQSLRDTSNSMVLYWYRYKTYRYY